MQTFCDHESKGKFVAKLVRPIPAPIKDSTRRWEDVGYQGHAIQDKHQKNRCNFLMVKKFIWESLQDMPISAFDSVLPISPEVTKVMMEHMGKATGSIPSSTRS